MAKTFVSHTSMAHTRWATHGPPSEVNSHPHRSDVKNSFLVVHNGIITNYRELKTVLEKKGYVFESETDTECIAKLFKYFYDSQRGGSKGLTFTNLVKAVVKELVCHLFYQECLCVFLSFESHKQEGAFALIVKSVYYPHQMIATREISLLQY